MYRNPGTVVVRQEPGARSTPRGVGEAEWRDETEKGDVGTYLSSVEFAAPNSPGPVLSMHWQNPSEPASHGMRTVKSSMADMQEKSL